MFTTRAGFACAVNIVLGVAGFTLMIHFDPFDWRLIADKWELWVGPLWFCVDDNRPSAYAPATSASSAADDAEFALDIERARVLMEQGRADKNQARADAAEKMLEEIRAALARETAR